MRFYLLPLTLVLLLFFVDLSAASHFRGGTVSWTRASATSRTVTVRSVMHFYTGGIFPRWFDVRIRWGDGSSNTPSSDSNFLNGTWDSTGTVRTLIYEETHTYPELRLYKAYIYSVARQHAIINGPDQAYRVEAGVNLALPGCLGSPAGIIPGVTYLQIRPDAVFQIAAQTSFSQPLQYSWFDRSYLNINPPIAPAGPAATVVPATPSTSGAMVHWDTSSGASGSLYAVSVRADIVGVENCHAVWDVTVQLEEAAVPECTAGGGSYTLYTSEAAALSFEGSDGTNARHDAALIGSLPPGAVFSSLEDTTKVDMTWLNPVPGSYSFTVQFCRTDGLCGACSVSLNVDDNLPTVSVQTSATPGATQGTVEIVAVVENTSPNVEEVTLDAISSSYDGDLTDKGCPVNVTLQSGTSTPYTCTYDSEWDGSEANVISVSVSTTTGVITSSAGGQDEVDASPITTTAAATSASSSAATSSPTSSSTSSSSSSSTDGPSSSPSGPTTLPTAAPQVCGSLGTARCSSDSDCGDGGADQPGLCTASGFCECGVGYQGVGTNLDPAACAPVCTPVPVPDAVVSLNEPTLDSFAENGNLVVKVAVDPYLKQKPTSIATIHPLTGARCGILPERLGFCELTQDVIPGNCWTEYVWRRTTFFDAVNSGLFCFIELPNRVETGPQWTVVSRVFQTIFEVDLEGVGPFGLNTTRRRSETALRRTLRREYTYVVAVQVLLESDPFLSVADGAIQYRLIEIDTMPRTETVHVKFMTRVPAGGSVSPARLNATETTGLPLSVTNVQQTYCLAESKAGYCDQIHTVSLPLNPCAADGELVVNVGLQCDDPLNVDDPVSCGFINVPVGNVYTLDRMFVNYDSCPRSVTYGLDLSQSFLRLYTDATRTLSITAPITLGGTSFGRISLRGLADSEFQSCNLTSLRLMQVGQAGNVDLGDKLGASWLTMPGGVYRDDRVNPVWDFEVVHLSNDFALDTAYFWEATIDLAFTNTEGQKKKRQLVVRQLVHRVASRETNGVTSTKFSLESPARESAVPPAASSSASFPVAAVTGAVLGACAVGLIVLLVGVWQHRRRRLDEKSAADAPSNSPAVH